MKKVFLFLCMTSFSQHVMAAEVLDELRSYNGYRIGYALIGEMEKSITPANESEKVCYVSKNSTEIAILTFFNGQLSTVEVKQDDSDNECSHKFYRPKEVINGRKKITLGMDMSSFEHLIRQELGSYGYQAMRASNNISLITASILKRVPFTKEEVSRQEKTFGPISADERYWDDSTALVALFKENKLAYIRVLVSVTF